jgi:mycofactocin glycosyltransferase
MRYLADRSIRRFNDGLLIIGGSPLILQRLTAGGAKLLSDITSTAPAGEASMGEASEGSALDDEPGVTASSSRPHSSSRPAASRGPGSTARMRLINRWLETGVVHPVGDASRWTPGDVTAVIPAHNDDVTETVESLRGVSHIIIVDDGSTPPLTLPTHLLGQLGTTVEIVRRRVAGGPAAARNDGLLRVTTPLTAFVDADVAVSEGWLAPLLAQLDDDRVAVAAPRVSSAAGPSRRERYEQVRSPLDLGPEPARVRPATRVSYVPSACLVGRTDALADGFDPSLRYGEDVDALWRLIDQGAVVRYDPRSCVTHQPRTSWLQWWQQRANYGSAAGPLARRFGARLAPATCHPTSAVTWLLICAGQPLAGLATASISAGVLAHKLGDVPERSKVVWLLAGRGHIGAGRLLASAVRRAWWPIVILAASRSTTARRVAAASIFVGVLEPFSGAAKHCPPDLPQHRLGDEVILRALRVVDDVAYSTGLWRGVWRSRGFAALLPHMAWTTPRS